MHFKQIKEFLFGKENVSVSNEPENVLFQPIQLGSIGTLSNRIAMASLTRARTDNPEHTPNELMKKYYVQRKSAGLIISEGVHISPNGIGWADAPGIWTEEQAVKWGEIIQEVEKDGGAKMVAQLWHQGRQSHESLIEGDMGVVSASAIVAQGDGIHTRNGKEPFPVPRALLEEEIPLIVDEFRHAARMAKKAGFHGIELHAASGYLIDLFIQSRTNHRTDKYGGSIENRLRLLDEILTAVEDVYPKSAIGVKLGPNGNYGDMGSPDNPETFYEAFKVVAKHNLAFMEVVIGKHLGFHDLARAVTLEDVQNAIKEVQGDNPTTMVIANCGYTKSSAEEVLANKTADIVSFGRYFVKNPDLVERFKEGIDLDETFDPSVWFTPGFGAKGYTDYPTRLDVAK